MSADDGWDLTELGRQGGDTFDVRYDPETSTVNITGVNGPESFTVDRDRWQQQAARELATRGYGERWNRWDTTEGGGMVMSAGRTRYQDADPAYQGGTAGGTDNGTGAAGGGTDDWETGAARYSAAAASAPETPAPTYDPPQYGRVRVYPQYTFPVCQSGVGGIGLDQTITITDFDKKGRQWAEQEARRQVTEAMGAPPHDDSIPGGAWWMGQPTKDQFRWQPLKGTPRTAKPNDGQPEPPPWQPWRPRETETETETAGGTGAETGAETEPDMRFGADGEWISPDELDRRCAEAEAAGTPYVLQPMQVQAGDRVLDTSNGELGRVSDVTDGGVSVRYDRELTPGHPGSQGVHMLQGALATGTLQLVPRDSTYASLEDRKPPAEQAARYAERRAHYEAEHGPGKRGKKGWTAHKRGCRVCQDIDDGGDGTGRRLHVLAPAPEPVVAEAAAPAGPREPEPIGMTAPRYAFAGDGDGSEVTHWRWEAALDALRDHVGAWVIPDDGTGVLDTDSFIASLPAYVVVLGGVLARLGEDFGSGETPIAPVVGETLADFAAAFTAMADEAAEVHRQWQENEDNAHDLRRARGEIPGADLFNVAPAA